MHEDDRNAFFAALNKVRGLGLVQMVKAHTNALQYHIAEHAAEVSYDTSMILERLYGRKFPAPDDKLTNQIFKEIASAAAAWHDVFQADSAPFNEIASAKQFTACMQNVLTSFSHKHDKCKYAIEVLLTYMDFIASELIVYDTWLVFGLNEHHEVAVKTLRQHANSAESKGVGEHYEKNPMIIRLALAADAISISDTSRFALEHVCETKHLVNMIAELPESSQKALNAFFDYAKLHDLKLQQEFLGLIGQGIRMFCELNSPDKAYITPHQFTFFCETMQKLRMQDKSVSSDDYKTLLHLFMTTAIKKAHKTTIQQEIYFAKAIGNGLWNRHAHDLEILAKYYLNLDDANQIALAQAIFIMSTAYQEGLVLLRADNTFKELLKAELHPGALQTFLHPFQSAIKEELRVYERLINK
jgi:hypothetical protein